MPADAAKSPILALRSSISSDEADPSSNTDGLEAPDSWDEVAFFIGGGTSCEATVWWYNELAGTWHEGVAATVTGNQVVLGYDIGSRVDCRLTSVVGTYRVDARFISKDA